MVFSFGEPGFQEFETVKYLTGILEQNGFKVERNVAGIPTGFVATWGSGKPVISLGSDIDDIPQASNKPGVGWHDPLVEGAPGHGEGHNSGEPLNIAAAIAVKKIMERDHIPGHDQGLGRRRRRAHVRQGVARARRRLQGRGRHAVHARREQPRRFVRPVGLERAHLRDLQVQGPGGARGRRAVARQERARRGDAHGHVVGVPARAHGAGAALALRDPRRRRPAERRADDREHLVLLPQPRLRSHDGDVRGRQEEGAGRRDDDRHTGRTR